MPKVNLSDEVILKDALTCQKDLTNSYNIAANETAGNNGLRSDMLNILMQEHELQSAMFNAAAQKGWYQTEQAEQKQIDKALQKYRQGSKQS
ncbi:MAG: spore coat protein [Bacillota bacterium]|jgi:spore coat protein CotF